jgi:hypothetical protein
MRAGSSRALLQACLRAGSRTVATAAAGQHHFDRGRHLPVDVEDPRLAISQRRPLRA